MNPTSIWFGVKALLLVHPSQSAPHPLWHYYCCTAEISFRTAFILTPFPANSSSLIARCHYAAFFLLPPLCLHPLLLLVSQKSPPAGSPAASNKTELSAKVEAELFEEYDAMVPGPAASAVGNNAGGDGAGQERTGRPLKINLDLLSYQAKQKNIKVRCGVPCGREV